MNTTNVYVQTVKVYTPDLAVLVADGRMVTASGSGSGWEFQPADGQPLDADTLEALCGHTEMFA